MFVQSLEARRLLSVTLAEGVLTVTGTADDDQLAVGRGQTMIVVNDNGTTSEWNPADVQSIVINGLEGNDQIAVFGPVLKPITANGGAGEDALRGGPGREHLFGDAGNDRIHGGGGGDLINGGVGDDILFGGPGPDHMLGEAGNDRFDSVDRNQDVLNGGDGIDAARVNRGDRTHFIEHVRVVLHPAPTLTATEPLEPISTVVLVDELASGL